MRLTKDQNRALAAAMRQAGDKKLSGWADAKQAAEAALDANTTFEDHLTATYGAPATPQPGSAYPAVWKQADTAGKAAADACVPVPMYVGTPTHPLGHDIDPSKPVYHVPDGVCGFAWVNWKGNTGWGRWTAREGLTRKDTYYGGQTYWISGYGQSMERKEAYARAFAAVLNEHGIPATAMSRMD